MRPLYVTSFTAEMYALTGVHLVQSFLDTHSDGTLLLCHEGDLRERPDGRSRRLEYYDLAQSAFLREWLAANRDIIPRALGGDVERCDCRKGHTPGCGLNWFNKNASRWFRKIVSLDFAWSYLPCDAVVWIDCDCRFMRRLPASVLTGLFDAASVLYHKSPDRKVIESGVIAFKRDWGGDKVLTSVVERFRNGAFRQDLRWDDGYQFQLAIEASTDVASKDLGRRAPESDVLPSSPLGTYITHFKGTHKYAGIMA